MILVGVLSEPTVEELLMGDHMVNVVGFWCRCLRRYMI